MDQWSYGWEDPRGYEQDNFYGGGHQEWNSYAVGSMSSCNGTCALCNSPWHSSFECSLRFECPDFMQECEYEMGMYQETFVPDAYPQEEAYEPSKEFVEGLLAQLQASRDLLHASQARISQETMVPEGLLAQFIGIFFVYLNK
ncbi:putative transcription factor interactor and regulator CCHC(Zn) family [Rosa chinensis]|uniref:Putative transcription factor interactor and regulator CCHC(Zn) family n=1 Tax=Rosa chinensis TaxID=74649 RepID=A0A2P6RC12_ROSCH|nr:putative transcription factor interactor and regulator CCHC(Zn) family [Rosa chinensis]